LGNGSFAAAAENLRFCPALCRASTSWRDKKGVDGRDKPGHDGLMGTSACLFR
jgi:hypothetical protein